MKISIIGAAGTVGSATAFAIAVQGLADELVMIDEKQNFAGNHAMDINTAVSGMFNIVVRAGGYEDIGGSDVTIVCAGIHVAGEMSAEEKLSPNIPLMKTIAANIRKYCPDTIILTVTNPIDILNYVLYLAGDFNRKQMLGYNFNDSIRLRAATAKALGVSPLQVNGIAAGYHPSATVSLFSAIKVGGQPVALDAAKIRSIQDEAKNYLKALDALGANRTAGWTTAAGLALTVKAIRDDAKVLMPCSAVLEGEYGYRDLSIGIPVIIGKEGIHRILEWDLPPGEREELDKVAARIKTECAVARKLLNY